MHSCRKNNTINSTKQVYVSSLMTMDEVIPWDKRFTSLIRSFLLSSVGAPVLPIGRFLPPIQCRLVVPVRQNNLLSLDPYLLYQLDLLVDQSGRRGVAAWDEFSEWPAE